MGDLKLALLSNVNMNSVIRMLGKSAEVYEAEGYGNELGTLMNPSSSYHIFAPDVTFLVEDLMELLEHDLDLEAAGQKIRRWFADLRGALKPKGIYYISDAYLWGVEMAAVFEPGRKAVLERLWQESLEELCHIYENVRILPYRRLIEALGEENAFSLKMWYMGKILLGSEAQKRLCSLILDKVTAETRTPKKVLLLDLDDTLWGGLAGENDHTSILLSEEHVGLAYKNLQRVLLQMRKQGVVLGIVSKNNESDALAILEKHPHMVLAPSDFAAKRINWAPKHENIREIARELNLSEDSFVFWDDNPAERQLIKELLPQVTVPGFPEKPEELAPAMTEIFWKYFAKPSITEEDLAKTAQYAANRERKKLQDAAGNFEDYLKKLEIAAVRVAPEAHTERLIQLMNKTNQFNLTTRRYTQGQMTELLEDDRRRIYLYRVTDRFGDNGVVAAAIVDLGEDGDLPILTDFVMSCRVMGKNIEYAIVEDIENDLYRDGYSYLEAIYVPSSKNGPVAEFYERLGYEKTGAAEPDGVKYKIKLAETPKRMYYVRMDGNSEGKNN